MNAEFKGQVLPETNLQDKSVPFPHLSPTPGTVCTGTFRGREEEDSLSGQANAPKLALAVVALAAIFPPGGEAASAGGGCGMRDDWSLGLPVGFAVAAVSLRRGLAVLLRLG